MRNILQKVLGNAKSVVEQETATKTSQPLTQYAINAVGLDIAKPAQEPA